MYTYVHLHAKVRAHEVSFSVVLHLSLFFPVLFTCVYMWCVTCVDKCMYGHTYVSDHAHRGPRLIL